MFCLRNAKKITLDLVGNSEQSCVPCKVVCYLKEPSWFLILDYRLVGLYVVENGVGVDE